MAVTPTRILEAEFDAGVWTDLGADLVDLSTRRGRNRESGAFETGQLVFTVRNDDRKYDPDHAAGPYYGKLRPNRRVRLRATYGATTYPVFSGYIDRIAQQYGGPNDATAEFQVSDAFKILNRVELPRSVYAAEVADDNPGLWWPLGEPSGSTTVVDATGSGRDGTVNGNVTFGEAGLVVRDPDGAVRFNEAANAHIGPGHITLSSANVWAIEMWVQLTVNPTYTQTFLVGTTGSTGLTVNYIEITINPTSRLLNLYLENTAGTGYQVTAGAALTVGQTYHVVVSHNSDRVLRIYINGVLSATGDTTAGTFEIPDLYLGAIDVGASPAAIIDEFAVYTATGVSTALSAARITAHNAAGRTPWTGDDPGTRLVRIFETVTTPGSYVIGAGTTELQATSLGGTALAYAQKVEETELGSLFVNAEGDVTFIGREEGQTGDYLTSQATLVDDDSGAGIPYRAVSADVDEARLVTRATVSREGSVAITYTDDAAAGEYQLVDETHEGLLHADDDYSRSYAEWIVNTHRTPASRIGTVTLDLTRDPAAMYPAILALELGERVTYRRTPQDVGATIDQPMRVEAIGHETGGHYWRTRLQLSPFNLAGYPVIVWDTTTWDNHVWGV
jgi:hypothetical protein